MLQDKKNARLIVAPVDGSDVSFKSLEYVHLMWGTRSDISITLLYILPTLPQLLDEAGVKLRNVEIKNIHMGEQILSKAKEILRKKGFAKEQVKAIQQKKEVGISRDICTYALQKVKADALVISTHGRSKLEAFFIGEVANKVLEYSRSLPVWLVNGDVTQEKVLIGIDRSENCLRAAEHVGVMLSNTGCKVALFHTTRDLRNYMPKEVLEDASDLEELWKTQAGQEISPYIEKAREALIKAGFPESDISANIVDGSRSAAADILHEANTHGFGTIVLGRRGRSNIKDFLMGSVTRKVIHGGKGLSIWVVN